MLFQSPHSNETLRDLPERIDALVDAAAEHWPSDPAFLDGDICWDHVRFRNEVDATAEALLELGVRGGDRIMVVAENGLAIPTVLMAASRLDAWAIVANPRLTGREIDGIAEHSRARRILFASGQTDAARAHAERHRAEPVELGSLTGLTTSPLSREVSPEPVWKEGRRQVAVLVYTSGTTGAPKGVMLTHHNVLASAAASRVIRELRSSDLIYGVLPMSHIVGLVHLGIAPLLGGAGVRLVARYDPAALVQGIEKDVSILLGVPATYQRLLEHLEVRRLDAIEHPRLRLLSVSGAPLDATLKGRVERLFGVPLLNGYGITECSPGISGWPTAQPRADTSVGLLLPGLEGRLVGASGREVQPDEAGELHVRGPNVMLGYYRAPDLTAAAIDPEGWFNTGDLARVEDGALFICGRTKEMIIRSGFNVYPAEVEAVLNSHPEIVQSAVVGRSADGNEEVVAYVQLMAGSAVTEEDIAQFVRPLLGAYKRPAQIVLLKEMPATSTGKILKHVLKERARDETGTGGNAGPSSISAH